MRSLHRRFSALALALISGSAIAPNVAGDQGEANARALLRARLVDAYARTPRVLERLEITKRCGDARPRTMYVEMYREGRWFGISTTERDPDDEPDARPDLGFAGLAFVSDGREWRGAERGFPIARMKGPTLYEEDRAPFIRAVSELATLLAAHLGAFQPVENAFEIGVKPAGDGKFSLHVSGMVGVDLTPSWLHEDLWIGGSVREDRPGRYALSTPDATWYVRASDGGLDGWESKHPNADCVCSATTILPTWKPEDWQRRIGALLARPSSLGMSADLDALTARALLTEAIDLLLVAIPTLPADSARLSRVADVLVGSFLRHPAIASHPPLTFGTIWPSVEGAVLGAKVEDSPRRASLLAAFERATTAALASGDGAVPPKAR